MIDPSLLFAALDTAMHVDQGGERDDSDALGSGSLYGLYGNYGAPAPGVSAGAYESWPWRPSMPLRPLPQVPGGEMPPPCPLHVQAPAPRPVYVGQPPSGWAHTM